MMIVNILMAIVILMLLVGFSLTFCFDLEVGNYIVGISIILFGIIGVVCSINLNNDIVETNQIKTEEIKKEIIENLNNAPESETQIIYNLDMKSEDVINQNEFKFIYNNRRIVLKVNNNTIYIQDSSEKPYIVYKELTYENDSIEYELLEVHY